MINKSATERLRKLIRVQSVEAGLAHKKEVLLLPSDVEVLMSDNYMITTKGLGDKCDIKKKDLLRIIEIQDATNLKFVKTNILSPRTYAESIFPIPQHISVQCVLLSEVKKKNIENIIQLVEQTKYDKTEYDKMWISNKKDYKDIAEGTILYIMNRRVGGWDGSIEHPVIELLGAGGHVGVNDEFVMIDPIDTVVKELEEEMGIKVSSKAVKIFGGFHNEMSNELVILCGVFIASEKICSIQEFSLKNYAQDVDGIYLGVFEDVMELYAMDASAFAGGESAKASNFPAHNELMTKVYHYISRTI